MYGTVPLTYLSPSSFRLLGRPHLKDFAFHDLTQLYYNAELNKVPGREPTLAFWDGDKALATFNVADMTRPQLNALMAREGRT